MFQYGKSIIDTAEVESQVTLFKQTMESQVLLEIQPESIQPLRRLNLFIQTLQKTKNDIDKALSTCYALRDNTQET